MANTAPIRRVTGPSETRSSEENPMKTIARSRRRFLRSAGLTAGALLLAPGTGLPRVEIAKPGADPGAQSSDSGSADYTLHIKTCPVEIAPKRFVSATTYNGQFPGPLLRFQEGQIG